MVNRTQILILLVYLTFSCTTSDSDPGKKSGASVAENSQEHLLMSVLWYQKSAEMRAAYYQAFNWAKIKIENHIKNNGCINKAVVLDIDETILDNSPFQVEMIRTSKSYDIDFWYEWTKLARARPLPGALEFTNYANSAGIEIFYVSNRTLSESEATLKNLNDWGFPLADRTHLLLKNGKTSKKERRDEISKKYEIILFLGDNLNDFSELFEDRSDNYGFNAVDTYREEFGNRFIILPNPMYGAWEKTPYMDQNSPDTFQKIACWKSVLEGFK